MENVANALKMAAATLIFIIAIGTSFSLFGTAKQTADAIITMRDKQKYLETAELDTVLYTSSDKITSETESGLGESQVSGFTSKGDRIVSIADVFSTIYRYSKEKYGVTIVQSNGDVIARYDSNTDNIMRLYSNIIDFSAYEKYIEELKKNTTTTYVTPNFNEERLREIYKIQENDTSKVGAPWYGNDKEIEKRINADISGGTYTYNNQTYTGKKLLEKLKDTKIIEVTNEIDTSKYLEDTDENGNSTTTNLLQQYEMPTVEIIYIVY